MTFPPMYLSYPIWSLIRRFALTAAHSGIDANLFNVIKQKYAQAGYKLPRLVFWNVNSRTGTVPVRQNKLGVALVSGFSVNICNMVMSGELDPYKCLLDTINSERYKPVEDLLIA